MSMLTRLKLKLLIIVYSVRFLILQKSLSLIETKIVKLQSIRRGIGGLWVFLGGLHSPYGKPSLERLILGASVNSVNTLIRNKVEFTIFKKGNRIVVLQY